MSKFPEFIEYAAKESQVRFNQTLLAYTRYLMLGSGAAIVFIATRLLDDAGTLGAHSVTIAILAFGCSIIVSGLLLYLFVIQTYFEGQYLHKLFGFVEGYGADREDLLSELGDASKEGKFMRGVLKYAVGTCLFVSGSSFFIGIVASLYFLIETV